MDIYTELRQYEKFVTYDDLKKRVELFLFICPEPAIDIIPSLILGPDGPTLSSLFLLTEIYLSEVRINTKEIECDYIKKDTIYNFRVKLSDTIVTRADGTTIIFQVAQVLLLHDLAAFNSKIEYVGDDWKIWLKKIIELIPVS